ncbi:MAG: hypothetical protein ABIQ33_07310 [Caldimonas sp.]
MSTKNLSTVANEVISAYGVINMNVINAYRFGGERMIGFVDQRFAGVVNRGTAFTKELRTNLIASQQRVSGYYVKGLQTGSDRAHSAVGVAVDLASKGVNIVATTAERLDRRTNLNALDKLNRAVMPAANVVVQVVERIEQGSGKLVQRVSGKDMPANAVATRSLNASTRKAAAARKQVTKTVTKAQRTATKRVSKAVAKTATKTSNAARRVARKASSVAASA